MAHTSWRSNTINPAILFPSSCSSTTSEDGMSSSFQLQYGHFLRYWTGMVEGNIHVKEIIPESPSRRRVSFSTAVKVILIPSREEFRQANIFDQVWYNRVTDFAAFKRSACYELSHFMAHHQLQCHKEALRRLYQPCDIDHNEQESDGIDPSSSSSCIINMGSMDQKQEELTIPTIALVSTSSSTDDDIDIALHQVCEAAVMGARRSSVPSSSSSSFSHTPPSSSYLRRSSCIDSEGIPETLGHTPICGSPRSIATKAIIPSPPTSPPINSKQKSCLKSSSSNMISSSTMEKITSNYSDDLTLGGMHPLALMSL